MPGYYVPLTLWIQALFAIYTILAYCALAAYGGAMLSTHLLPLSLPPRQAISAMIHC